MTTKLRPLWQLTLLFAAALLSSPAQGASAAGADGLKAQFCEVNKGACSQKSGDLLVSLSIDPKPVKVMQELTFTVTLPPEAKYETLKLDLQMVGMYMGPNQVTLFKTGPGKYSGKGVIPKCHSGKRLWIASAAIPGHAPASFQFNVLY
jgi:hypothetical protein